MFDNASPLESGGVHIQETDAKDESGFGPIAASFCTTRFKSAHISRGIPRSRESAETVG